MANLRLEEKWNNGIYQLETTDLVIGGENGIDNLQAKQIGSNVFYLRKKGVENWIKNTCYFKYSVVLFENSLYVSLIDNNNNEVTDKKFWVKLNAADASTSHAGIVLLSSDINSDSECTAATSRAIKEVNDKKLSLAGGKITGDLVIEKKNAGIKLSTNDTNYTLSTSATGDAFSFYFPDAVNDYTQRLIYTKQDKTFNFKSCDVKINDSDVITSENIKHHTGCGKIIAWGRFDYFTNLSINIIASEGVSAITRRATGRYTITLSTPVDDIKYVVTCNSQQNTNDNEYFANTCVPMRLRENQFEIWCGDNQQDKFFDTNNCYFIVVVNNN